METEEQVYAQMNVMRFLEKSWGFSEGIVDGYDHRFSKYHDSVPQVLRYVFKPCHDSALCQISIEDDCCPSADRYHSNALIDRVGAVVCDSLWNPFWHIKTGWAKTFLAWDNLFADNKIMSICGGIYAHNFFLVSDILRSESWFFHHSEKWSHAILIDGLVIPATRETPTIKTSVPSLWLNPLRMYNFQDTESALQLFRLLFSRRKEFQKFMNAAKFFSLKWDWSLVDIPKPNAWA